MFIETELRIISKQIRDRLVINNYIHTATLNQLQSGLDAKDLVHPQNLGLYQFQRSKYWKVVDNACMELVDHQRSTMVDIVVFVFGTTIHTR